MQSQPTIVRGNRRLLDCCRLIFSALVPCLVGIFSIIFTLQQQSLSNRQRQQEQRNQLDAQRQTLFDAYIEDISKLLLQTSETNRSDDKFLLYARTKTLNALRNLNVERKKHILLFLYESRLLQTSGLDLRGADFNDVQLIGPYQLDYLHLPGVFWSNALFVDCSLTSAVFDQSYMINARFINSALQRASLPETRLDNADFERTTVFFANFTGASLIRANFVNADVVQGITFTNADLLHAQFTEDQLNGKRIYTTAHAFHQARFPNGSFARVEPRGNFIRNGDAEVNCSTAGRVPWSLVERGDEVSVIKTDVGHNWGNCMFRMRGKTRVSQEIDLRQYSLLIDNGKAMFSSSAFFGCNVSGNFAYVEVTTHRSDGILHGNRLYLSLTDEMENGEVPMHRYSIKQHLLAQTRKARILFGITPIEEVSLSCYFDNITFNIDEYKDLF